MIIHETNLLRTHEPNEQHYYRSGPNVPRFLMYLGLGWNKI